MLSDFQCPKCKYRFGGRIDDDYSSTIACPKCGYAIDLKDDITIIKEFKQHLINRKYETGLRDGFVRAIRLLKKYGHMEQS